MSARDKQIGGNHYKDMAIQPVEYIEANGIGYSEGCIIKYVSRWRVKGGVQDLEKARHFLDMLIELEKKHIPKYKTGDMARVIKLISRNDVDVSIGDIGTYFDYDRNEGVHIIEMDNGIMVEVTDDEIEKL